MNCQVSRRTRASNACTFGSFSIKSWAYADLHASRTSTRFSLSATSSIEDPASPNTTFSKIVPLNSVGSLPGQPIFWTVRRRKPTCCTRRMFVRSHWMLRSLVSCPSRVIRPPVGEYHLSSSPTMVLFPEPLAPTSAVVLFAGMDKSRPWRTSTVGLEGYAKRTSRISMFPRHSAGLRPLVERESILDCRSMTLKSSWAAAVAFDRWIAWGATCVRA